jgi:hypothetical protein
MPYIQLALSLTSGISGMAIMGIETTHWYTRSSLMSGFFLAMFGLLISVLTAGIFHMMFGQDMNPGTRAECRLTLKTDAMLLHQIDMLLAMPSAVSNV